jgi:hypothetical protein
MEGISMGLLALKPWKDSSQLASALPWVERYPISSSLDMPFYPHLTIGMPTFKAWFFFFLDFGCHAPLRHILEEELGGPRKKFM